MKHAPQIKTITNAPEFWMFIDAKRLTCPECGDSAVYGTDQIHLDPNVLVCFGVEDVEKIENLLEAPW
jgi:hypothetical protein